MPQQPAGFVPDGFEPDTPSSKPTPKRDWGDTVLDWLPAIGGATGGLIGGGAAGPPGAVGGAAVGGAAGSALKSAAAYAMGKAKPTDTVASASVDVAKNAAMQGAFEGAGQVLGPIMRWTGSRVMQSAAKPGIKTLLKGVKSGSQVQPVVQTLLDEGVNVTPGGLDKLQALLGETNDAITQAVAPSPAQISRIKVAGRLNDTAQTFATQVNPQADLDTISQVGENFLNHPNATSASMSVPDAQAMKVGTYKLIRKKYGQISGAGIEAEKGIARGLKEEIAAAVPGVSDLNAREGKLLEALDVVGRRVALAGNRDPIGFAWVAHNPTTFLAALMDRSPAVKSLVARGLYNQAGAVSKTAPQLIRIAVASLASEYGGGDSSADQSSQ